MIGLLVTIASFFALLFMCATLTKEGTESALRKQKQQWGE